MQFVTNLFTNSLVKIEWQIKPDESPFLNRRIAEWRGVRLHRAHVLPGRMLEHAAPCHELNITISGNLTTHRVTSTGTLQTIRGGAGSLCFTPYGQTIEASWEKPLDNMGILLDPGFVRQTAIENHFSSSFEFVETSRTDDPLIQHIGFALLEETSSETPAGNLYADSLIQSLTLHLLRNYTSADSLPSAPNGGLSGYKLRRVQEFINDNLDSELGLAELAGIAGLSQYHFARSFRKSAGITPQQYVMQQRIERAKILLARPEIPIVEVSLRSGFKNQSHFSALFRKFTNLTPKSWRDLRLA